MLANVEGLAPGLFMALALFAVIRPVATVLTLLRVRLSGPQRAFIAWFGVRGVGSLYYLTYALAHGGSSSAGRVLADITLVVIAASILLHGASATPLMRRHPAADGLGRPAECK
jgi:NhaP-type Na+/H+ or K+/H+ antiporter